MLNNKRERRMLQGLNDDDRFFNIRNILNIIFIIGAVIGVLLYVYSSQTVGTIIILISMVFKIIECILRFIR